MCPRQALWRSSPSSPRAVHHPEAQASLTLPSDSRLSEQRVSAVPTPLSPCPAGPCPCVTPHSLDRGASPSGWAPSWPQVVAVTPSPGRQLQPGPSCIGWLAWAPSTFPAVRREDTERRQSPLLETMGRAPSSERAGTPEAASETSASRGRPARHRRQWEQGPETEMPDRDPGGNPETDGGVVPPTRSLGSEGCGGLAPTGPGQASEVGLCPALCLPKWLAVGLILAHRSIVGTSFAWWAWQPAERGGQATRDHSQAQVAHTPPIPLMNRDLIHDTSCGHLAPAGCGEGGGAAEPC